MSSNIFWTPEQDVILIDFMRNHDVLYNIRHPDYITGRCKLNNICGKVLGPHLKNQVCENTKFSKKRSELLSFLDSFAASQRPTTTNVGSSQGLSDVTQLSPTVPNIDTGPGIITPEILEHDFNDDFGKMEKFESMTPKKKKKLTHSEERFKAVKTDS
ncbi:hypothetical protein TNCT_463281 [Trichonephila clavata]|uniref:Uncharacterized protein n=1 Tax=Trichonephila clavata TaxID=2740835 RepID=A0A8X6KB11_TRICU|nr:hypothetical protein TNCT_463281 [Trichonephila clavata]